MKKELNGILICTLLIAIAVLPATGTVNNVEKIQMLKSFLNKI